ncbi:MAG: hypothetical protein ACI8VE_000498 [Natrialbaceae archaeon]|jgi:hypothetical protein
MTFEPSTDPSSIEAARRRRNTIRSADSLADLVRITGADNEHEAYIAAKDQWASAMETIPSSVESAGGLPGTRVFVDGATFWIHGITHAGTDAERRVIRDHVERFLEADETVYCEQGVRRLYFDDYPDVYEMDDYRWAMAECQQLDVDSRLEALPEAGVDRILEDLTEFASQFRAATFSLLEASSDLYGSEFASALGDVASVFFMTHEGLATREEYEAFARSLRAAENPARLPDLQAYYARSFLPQHLEREWLRRHDPELEVLTHARNERMAAYAIHHHEAAKVVHLIVGAAHQPGIAEYLQRYREGRPLSFDPTG